MNAMSSSNVTKLGPWFWISSVLWVSVVVAWWYVVASGLAGKVIQISDSEHWKSFGYFVGTLGVGPVAIYLAAVRTRALAQQAVNDSSKVENDYAKLTNENFTKSIELLGNSQASVRQGAIFALQRLLKEKDLYPTIILILCSFVRDTSQEFKARLPNDWSSDIPITTASRGTQDSGIDTATSQKTLPVDIEAALIVIRDRKSRDINDYESEKIRKRKINDPYLFDLSNSFILNNDLTEIDLRYFNISDCVFEGCVLQRADFSGANLSSTLFRESDLTDAQLKDAELGGCDLFSSLGLMQNQINEARCDTTTKLPDGLTIPASKISPTQT
jgi:hypothetical protein